MRVARRVTSRVSSSVLCGSRVSGTNLPRALGRRGRHEEVRAVQPILDDARRDLGFAGYVEDARVHIEGDVQRRGGVCRDHRSIAALVADVDGERFGGRSRRACFRSEV